MSVLDEPPDGPVQSSGDLTGSWPSDESPSQSTFLNGDSISPEPGEKNQKPNTAATLDCSDLVAKIQAGDPAAMEQLYATFSRGMRYYLNRQLGPDVEDNVHDRRVNKFMRRADKT